MALMPQEIWLLSGPWSYFPFLYFISVWDCLRRLPIRKRIASTVETQSTIIPDLESAKESKGSFQANCDK